MNANNQLTHKVLALSLISVVLFTATFANAAGTQFSGPRNTIPHVHSARQPANRSVEGLRASREDAMACQKVRIVHYGHPGKGADRLERIDIPCGRTHLSTR